MRIHKKLSLLTEEEAKVLIRMRNPKSRVSVDEAKEQASWVIDFLSKEESGASRKIKSVSALASDDIEFAAELNSNGIKVPDTLVYIVNFEDSLGFAIISADTRIDDPLLAFAGSGSITDSIDNPGVAIFFGQLEDYMLNSIIEAERQKDSLAGGILEKLDIETNTKSVPMPSIDEVDLSGLAFMTNPPEIVDQIKPLVHVEWGQGTPFNDNLAYKGCKDKEGNIKNGGRVLAGCVAVAVAHIMSYWKHPTKIGSYSFDWDKLNEYTGNRKLPSYPDAAEKHIDDATPDIKNQVANLMKQIGQPVGKGIGMDYGCDGSIAYTEAAIPFLYQNGFSVMTTMHKPPAVYGVGVLMNYDSDKAIASMKRKEPLIVDGCSKKKTYKFLIFSRTIYNDCHDWVIDGYIKRRTVATIGYDGRIIDSKDEDYIHNNWGWNGKDNGYYKSGVFDSRLGPDIFSDGTTKSSGDYNYQYRIRMTPHILR